MAIDSGSIGGSIGVPGVGELSLGLGGGWGPGETGSQWAGHHEARAQQQFELAQEAYTNPFKRRIESGMKYGISPLASIGARSSMMSPISSQTNGARALRPGGKIMADMEASFRVKDKLEVERQELINQKIRKEIDLMGQPDGTKNEFVTLTDGFVGINTGVPHEYRIAPGMTRGLITTQAQVGGVWRNAVDSGKWALNRQGEVFFSDLEPGRYGVVEGNYIRFYGTRPGITGYNKPIKINPMEKAIRDEQIVP